MTSRQSQRGMGLFKLIFVFGSIALVATIGMKCFPLYSNQFKLAKAVKNVAQEGGEPATMKSSLQKRWDIEDINFLQPKDIEFQRGDNGAITLKYNYEARAHLFYNVDLVLTFSGSEKANNG